VSAPSQPSHPDEPNSSDPDAAVVIVNFRTPELVEACLASVAATCGELKLETVIVDNGSGDGSVERLRASVPWATVIPLAEDRGFAAGLNAGFRHTVTELVVALTPDTEVRAGTVQALLARLRSHPRAGVVAPLLEDADGRLAPNGYRRFPNLFLLALDLCVPVCYLLVRWPGLHPYVMSPASLAAGERPAWVNGAVMAIRRAAYEQAGRLDEDFFLYFEDTEWQHRVAGRGWTIEIEPAARARHLVRGGGEAAEAPSEYFVRSALRYLSMEGVSVAVSRAVVVVSLASSWLTLRLIASLPSKRVRAGRRASAYGSLLRGALAEAPTV
jgi:GT2 family glycosyltransferase